MPCTRQGKTMNIEEDKNDSLKCEDCGKEDDVDMVECPYALEINDISNLVSLCQHCYYERGMDI